MNVIRRVQNLNLFNNWTFLVYKNQSRGSTKKCWHCQRDFTEVESKSFFCPCDLKKILPVNSDVDYFEMFNLKPKYKIDTNLLTKNFRQLMRKLHPDLYTRKSEVKMSLIINTVWKSWLELT